MKLPLQITFRQMESSQALEARIRELASKLEKFSDHIMRCQVVVEPLPGHQTQGNLFDFHINLTLPEGEVIIRRASPADPSHENPYVAVRDAFRAARRRLQNYEHKRRGEVKTHITEKPASLV